MPLTDTELQDIVLALGREREGRISSEDLLGEMRSRVEKSLDALVGAALLEPHGDGYKLTHGGWTIAGGLQPWSDPPVSNTEAP